MQKPGTLCFLRYFCDELNVIIFCSVDFLYPCRAWFYEGPPTPEQEYPVLLIPPPKTKTQMFFALTTRKKQKHPRSAKTTPKKHKNTQKKAQKTCKSTIKKDGQNDDDELNINPPNPCLGKRPQRPKKKTDKNTKHFSRLRAISNLSRQNKNTHFPFHPAWNETKNPALANSQEPVGTSAMSHVKKRGGNGIGEPGPCPDGW